MQQKKKKKKRIIPFHGEVVLQEGRENDCPICLGLKEKKYVCPSCSELFEQEANAAFGAILKALHKLDNWHLTNQRHACRWERPVLAQVVKGSNEPFCSDSPLPIKFLGICEDELETGSEITALVELMEDDAADPYVLAQVVEDAKSNVMIAFNQGASIYARYALPFTHGYEIDRFVSVGFVSANRAQSVIQ